MTEKRAQKLLAELTAHYRCRVAPVSAYCSALLEWERIMVESGYAPQVKEARAILQFPLMKSCLADRLVYGGEKVRKTPCPVHKGHWSGCVWGDRACPEGCMYGENVTGWLPEPHAFVLWERDEDQQRYFPMETVRCRVCGGLEEAGIHGD